MRISTGIIVLMVAQGLAGCDRPGSSSWPLGPSVITPAPAPVPISLIRFTDPTSGLSTFDVRDAQEQIVRLNSASELIWVADGSRFPGYSVGRFGINDGSWEVRFGTRDGERRAYLVFSLDYHHYAPPAIVVDLDVVDGKLVMIDTQPPVPLPGG